MSAVIVKAEDEGLHFGLKICPSLAWLKTDTKNIESDGSKFGFSYGLITEFKFSDHYAFATGIDVNYRGGNLKSTTTETLGTTTTTTTDEQNITLQYIELPLTLKLKTNEIGYLTYYLQAGLAPGINIRARADTKSNKQIDNNGVITNDPPYESENDDVKESINNVNLSMLIGGGVEYTLSGSTVLLVGIQFNNGLLDVSDNSEIKMNSNTLGLAIGILF
jgi:opacity protein-like surface antigen